MANKEIAIAKRAAIDKASRKMFLAVCGASIILGLALVGSIYFIKWMSFNGKVIARKGEIIKDYKDIQSNVAALRNNIIGDGASDSGLANNLNLEVMARARDAGCVDIDSNPVDTEDNVELARICSALRVIPDALPSVRNDEAVYASLNKLFLLTHDGNGNPVEPESISPGGNGGTDASTGLNTIPISLSVKNTGSTTRAVLDTIERSIRNFDIQNATISWRGGSGNNSDQLELRGTAVAYYSSPIKAVTKTETIYADDSSKKGVKK
ncbi:MAG: hypothetical protein LBT19_02280 [Candidatus Nomurabacteria bacterium]|jgi:hypothetical protein|nr:hypothetical protein [Candidatus Nomurabacteria bacterium]